MMRLLLCYILIICASCTAKKAVVETPVNPKPEWTTERPLNNAYYIGIGSSAKLSNPTDYTLVAKKNALSDMSSEIKVQVSGESFFHTIDRNKEYSEEFQNMIRTTFKEEINDYEIIDSWEDERNFWIYTRISKAKHAQIKADKKNLVLTQVYNNYLIALDYKAQSKPADALDVLNTALLQMKEYWAEDTTYDTGTETILLANTVHNTIRQICSSIEIQTNLSDITLNYENHFQQTLTLAVSSDGKFINGLPIKHKNNAKPYSKTAKIYTNADGLVSIPVELEEDYKRNFQIEFWIDFEELLRNDDSPEMEELLLLSINPNRVSTPVNLVFPRVYFATPETEENRVISDAIKNQLQKNNFIIVSHPDAADLELNLKSSIKPGGTAQGFEVALLDFSVVLIDHKNQRQVFADAYTNIKGLHMSPTGAIGEAQKNCVKKIRKEIVPKMIEVML